MLQFYKITDEGNAADIVAKRLITNLSKGQKVLWLACGGSNIASEALTMTRIPVELQANLTVMLTDERYGELDHPDSNARGLREAGFRPGSAMFLPVLTPETLSLEDTATRYAEAVETAFGKADVIIAQFGIGADGHIAGVLPNSPAISSQNLVAGYDAGNFQRITLTPEALKKINVAYAFAFGEAKKPQLAKLQNKDLSLSDQPAQILKQIPEAYIYSDEMGESTEEEEL